MDLTAKSGLISNELRVLTVDLVILTRSPRSMPLHPRMDRVVELRSSAGNRSAQLPARLGLGIRSRPLGGDEL